MRAVVLDERLPRLGLRGLHPRQHVVGEQRPRPVVLRRVAVGVQPAVGGEVLADVVLEVDFLVQAHAASGCGQPAHVDLAGDGGGNQGGPAFLQQVDGSLGFGSKSVHLG